MAGGMMTSAAGSPSGITRHMTCGLLTSVLLCSGFCYAEELADPTRPPAAIAAPVVAAASGVVENKPLGLQSILISKTRRAAIIDGKTVELGGKYDGAKLIEVAEDRVVLQGAHGRQVMTLFPDVKMTGKPQVEVKSPVGKVQVPAHAAPREKK